MCLNTCVWCFYWSVFSGVLQGWVKSSNFLGGGKTQAASGNIRAKPSVWCHFVHTTFLDLLTGAADTCRFKKKNFIQWKSKIIESHSECHELNKWLSASFVVKQVTCTTLGPSFTVSKMPSPEAHGDNLYLAWTSLNVTLVYTEHVILDTPVRVVCVSCKFPVEHFVTEYRTCCLDG